MFTDYGALPSAERNVLRLIFLDPRARTVNLNWESVARFIVGVFRGDAARAGAAATVQPLWMSCARRAPTSPRCGARARSTAPARA